MTKRILILTEFGDIHAYAVSQALDRRGADVTLWHTTDFPSCNGETIHFERGERNIRVRGPALDLEDFRFDTVWHRRTSYALPEDKLHPADRRFADAECRLFRCSVFDLLAPDSFWVNPPQAAARAERKPFQHQIAHEVGFATPATPYTNAPEEIRSFLNKQGGQIVYKPLRGVSWSDGECHFTPYTSVITESTLVDDDLLRAVPGIYQEVVPKDYELRITVLGEQVFGAKIHSQETREGRMDWRRSYNELRIEACRVPAEIGRQCRLMLRRLGLVFGCFDLIVTPLGEHVFLEVNQMGQFLFVERYAGIPLLDAFVEFLMQARPDFHWEEQRVACRYPDLVPDLQQMEAELAKRHVRPPDRSILEDQEPSETQSRRNHSGIDFKTIPRIECLRGLLMPGPSRAVRKSSLDGLPEGKPLGFRPTPVPPPTVPGYPKAAAFGAREGSATLRLLGLGLLLLFFGSYDVVVAKVPSTLWGIWQAENGRQVIRIESDRIVEYDGHGVRVRRLISQDGDQLVLRRSGLKQGWRASMSGSRLCLECEDNSGRAIYRKLDQPPSQFDLTPFPVAPSRQLTLTQIQEIQQEIERRFYREQVILKDPSRQGEIDQERQRNLLYLPQLLADVGWIDSDRFGQSTSVHTVFLAKHTLDLRLMLTILPYAGTELKRQGKGQTYAILYDAVQLEHGRRQLYGTQVLEDRRGPFVLPLEDPENVDEHRAELGLPKLAAYMSEVQANLYNGRPVRIADDH